jgi:hypothetical protein
VTFAGVLFLVAALFNVVDGLVALADPGHFFVDEGRLVIDNYDAFGIVLLIVAGFQLLVGLGLLALQRWAQVVGIIVAILGAIAAFGHFTHYPAWSVILLVLYAVILYALTVYNDEFAAATAARRR